MITQRLQQKTRAFSLMELLVVMAIIAIVASFTVPAVSTLLRGSNLTRASQLLTDQLDLARQLATTKNRSIEVRFIRFGDPEVPGESVAMSATGQFRALQILELFENGIEVPVDKVQMLPGAIVMNGSVLSSLIQNQTIVTAKQVASDATAPLFPRGVNKNYDYVWFRFLADGSTNLAPDTTQPPYGIWYVTLHDVNDFSKIHGNNPPPNFFTLQIDPLNGSAKSYRPMAN